MKTSKALQILAVVMIAVLSCFIFTGKQVMAIVDKNLDEIFLIDTEEDVTGKEKKHKKLSRREQKEADKMTERLKMLKK